MYFQRIAEPKGHRDDFAIERYTAESRRLLEVLNTRIEQRPATMKALTIPEAFPAFFGEGDIEKMQSVNAKKF